MTQQGAGVGAGALPLARLAAGVRAATALVDRRADRAAHAAVLGGDCFADVLTGWAAPFAFWKWQKRDCSRIKQHFYRIL